MKTQIISILDGVVFGKLRYKFLTIISAIVITTAIGMLSLHFGLPRKYIEILAFGLPIPIFIVVCITFENLRKYSSLSKIRNIVGAPPGGFRPGDYDIAGNTTNDGAGFTDTWRPPFAGTDAKPDAVRKQEQIVVITRLAHSLSYPNIYDRSLRQLEESLNNNNPGIRFLINLQQSFWPSGNILLIIGEDPKVASTSGRVEGSLRDSFTETEKKQLKTYVESGGILLVMEATPYYSTGGFSTRMRNEVERMFGDQWTTYPIFFAGGDFIQEFNQYNTYNYLAGILSATLGKQIS